MVLPLIPLKSELTIVGGREQKGAKPPAHAALPDDLAAPVDRPRGEETPSRTGGEARVQVYDGAVPLP